MDFRGEKTFKDSLISAILVRWWYVLPDWPPAGFDYSSKLRELKLQAIPLEDWKTEKVELEEGFEKCYELPTFPGVFRSAEGEIYDLRPFEGKPCYNYLDTKSTDELIDLLETAVCRQSEALRDSPYIPTHDFAISAIKENLKSLHEMCVDVEEI